MRFSINGHIFNVKPLGHVQKYHVPWLILQTAKENINFLSLIYDEG